MEAELAILLEKHRESMRKDLEVIAKELKGAFNQWIEDAIRGLVADFDARIWQHTQLKPNFEWLVKKYGNLMDIEECDITDAPNRLGAELVLSIYCGKTVYPEWHNNHLIAVLKTE